MVSSELTIPELDPVGSRGVNADVHVGVADGAAPTVAEPRLSVSERRCWFSAPEAGDYLIQDGSAITVRPAVHADPWVVRAYLLGSAWAALLLQRGAFALHAGVASDEEAAVAFCAPPGAGKSSTVAWLLHRGLGFVCDDLCRLELPPTGPPQVWPSTPMLKLTEETLDALGWKRGRNSPRPDGKLHIRWEGSRAELAQPLGAVYVLGWGESARRRLAGSEAVQALLRAATYRPAMLEPVALLANHWQQCVELARRVPIWELHRRDWSDLEPLLGPAVSAISAQS